MGQKPHILLTGASGFVGRAVLARLLDDGHPITAAVRSAPPGLDERAGLARVPAFALDTDWRPALHGCSVVVHCAARVHLLNDPAPDPLAEFRRVNVDGTLALAHQAATAGVGRFVFISTVKVNGEGTRPGAPYTAFDTPAPQDAYGLSKWEAEEGLQAIGRASGMEIVIIRPVLVYGPGVKANFRSMMTWLARGVPLPLGAIHNQRSLVSLGNLVDLVATCVAHPRAAGQVFLASDGEDLSTTAMLQRLGQALGKPARLLPVPAAWLEGGAALLGKRAIAQRLCGSLQVDIRHTRETLDWTPPLSVDEGFRAAATAFLNE